MSRVAELTIDRLFDAPALAGPTILSIKISPDGRRVLYLRGRLEDKDRLDLWEYDIAAGRTSMLVDSNTLGPPAALSDEESGRRERQRIAALSGIVEYAVASSGTVLITLDGRLYLCGGSVSGRHEVDEVCRSDSFATGAAFSPQGRFIAFVRDQNLQVYDLDRRIERALSIDGAGDIKNGMAEFVAQEEMDRHSGFWWAPDERHIAFARIDESAVTITERFEISADSIASHAQRYPAAGGNNVLVRLGVVDVESGSTVWMDLGDDADIYLARVNWLPDSRTVAIQRQSRDQRRLDLLLADIDTGASRVVLTETSRTWIDLNNEITFLARAPEFIWASSRDGHCHLYLYDYGGRLRAQLTAGDWSVDDFRARAVKGVDEARRVIYFSSTERSPTERHLYAASLDPPEACGPRRVSSDAGVHSATMSADAAIYVDVFTSTQQPPQVSVRRADGSLIAHLLENRLDDRHPAAPYLPENSVPEIGSLPAADGQALYYRLFKPADFDSAKRYPAIVDVYGGPGVQRVLNTWSGNSFTQILTRAGYVVFQLDNRGTAFRGREFQAPIHSRLGQIEVDDQVRGANWLIARGCIDPSRLGIWGWSYGGYLALMLMLKTGSIFRAGVAGAPVTDWSLYDTHYTERYLGNPHDNARGYAASSVLPYAESLRGRLLVMHGMADDNVLFLHSTKLFREFQRLGKRFEVMVYPGGKHGLLRQQDGRHAYATMLDFFNENLAPRP